MKIIDAISKWLLAALMTGWLGVSIIFLAGDDDPTNPMPLLLFFVIKAIALGSLCLWGKVFMRLCDIHALPSILTDLPEEFDNKFEEEED